MKRTGFPGWFLLAVALSAQGCTAPSPTDPGNHPLGPHSFTSWITDRYVPEYVWGRYVDWCELGRIRGERRMSNAC